MGVYHRFAIPEEDELRYAYPPFSLLAGLVFFYPISRGLIIGQFALMLGAILIFSCGLLHQQDSPNPCREWLVGGLWAWCVMKPQITGLILLFFLLEALHKR